MCISAQHFFCNYILLLCNNKAEKFEEQQFLDLAGKIAVELDALGICRALGLKGSMNKIISPELSSYISQFIVMGYLKETCEKGKYTIRFTEKTTTYFNDKNISNEVNASLPKREKDILEELLRKVA